MLQPKQVKGAVLTGPMLATMISSYVSAINSGETMTITDTWEAVAVVQGQRAYSDAREKFEALLAKNPSSGDPWELPVATATLKEAFDNASSAAVRMLHREMLDTDEDTVAKLRTDMTSLYDKLCQANASQASQKYMAIIVELWAAAKKTNPANLEGIDAVLLRWREVQANFRASASEHGIQDDKFTESILNEFLATTVSDHSHCIRCMGSIIVCCQRNRSSQMQQAQLRNSFHDTRHWRRNQLGVVQAPRQNSSIQYKNICE